MTEILLYGIPNCDTVKRARAWLAAQGVVYRFHDFKKDGVPADRLDAWLAACGWEQLLNRRGTTWRQLDAGTQAGVVDALTTAGIPAFGPTVAWADGAITVGFDAKAWATRALG